MPTWVANELTVRGEPAELAAFVDAVRGIDEDGDSLPLSLQVIDPMPEEFETGMSYSDSDEYRELEAEFETLTDSDARRAFMGLNLGFVAERESKIAGHGAESGWYSWRRQHWGPKWEVSGQGFFEFDVRPGGNEALYRFDTATGGIEPAVTFLARRHPTLQFDLRTQHESMDEWVETHWRDGLRGPFEAD